jgi:hypothetical protein
VLSIILLLIMNKLITRQIRQLSFVRAFSTINTSAQNASATPQTDTKVEKEEEEGVKTRQPHRTGAILFTNARAIYGFNKEGQFFQRNNEELLLVNGKVYGIHKKMEDEVRLDAFNLKTVDCEGGIITPGLIDPHTHIFPGADRAKEFTMRVNKTYQEIAEAGGGIQSSVKHVREKGNFADLYKINE